jgi:hypothetical protein
MKIKNQVSKIKIHISLRYNPGKAGYPRIMPKRKARVTQNVSDASE